MLVLLCLFCCVISVMLVYVSSGVYGMKDQVIYILKSRDLVLTLKLDIDVCTTSLE